MISNSINSKGFFIISSLFATTIFTVIGLAAYQYNYFNVFNIENTFKLNTRKKKVIRSKKCNKENPDTEIDPNNKKNTGQSNTQIELKKSSLKSDNIEENVIIPLRIVYGTQTGTAKKFATLLETQIFALNIAGFHFDMSLLNIKDYDQDNLEHESIIVFILSTWTNGLPVQDAKTFCSWIEDMSLDFRVSKTFLKNVSFGIFGLGNAEYDEYHCTAAKNLLNGLTILGAKELCLIGLGDDNYDQENQFEMWADTLLRQLCIKYTNDTTKYNTKNNNSNENNDKKWLSQNEFRRQKRQNKKINNDTNSEKEIITEEDIMNDHLIESDDENININNKNILDLEDIGTSIKESNESNASNELNHSTEMVTPMQRRSLIKEGYKIIGTHSAVKLCRWTKHQLRGRGGCYKHTFYGITSYQCMETTPSLACANKCVFCWRHHKNPVGREWRWKVDPPLELVQGAIDNHIKMIKELKGLPGLILDRWKDAFTVKHCALSLVGEPIMYPYINEFVQELHNKNISSFLVTNAQFPDKISSLNPITQLYVSIDAATKDSLKEIDRPLFKDYWERYLECLKKLKEKGQRTVYRLTLVKSFNMKEVKEYCELIKLGEPDFIEIKAVTYCGKSDGSSLTMKDVPWHEEVKDFASAICNEMQLNEDNQTSPYALAAEHSHSNCVLLAKTKFYINNKWHTWIDYNKFHALVQKYYKDGITFTSDDYIAPTPDWAIYGSKEEGFDPEEIRFRRTKNGNMIELPYKTTDSGCG